MNRSMIALAIGLACGTGAAHGTEVKVASAPIATRDESKLFTDVPAPWRDYLLAARRAELIDDPLARCLAYPDLPGNEWPAGYGQAHCRYHFDDPLPAARIAQYLDAGDIAGLESAVRAVYAHHQEPGGEGAHAVFSYFTGASGPIDPQQLAERWVELAPKSGYAALALAEVWRGKGWDARGTRFVSETPPEALSAMDTYFEKAHAEFERAVKLQPDLIDAYIGLFDMAKAGGEDDASALAKAQALDPGCGELAYQRMTALEPRWGGSRPEMFAYASELQPLLAARPLLANQQSTLVSDYVTSLGDEARFSTGSLDLLDKAVRRSGEEASLGEAANVRINIAGDRRDMTRGVAELLQYGRFKEREAWADTNIGIFLVGRDPTWARRVMLHAVDEAPDNAQAHYLLAGASYNSRDFDVAEQHYLIAANDDDQRLASLREVSAMWLFDARLPEAQAAARAKPFVDRLLEAYPNDGRGLYMRMMIRSVGTARHIVANEDLQAFLKHAQLNDPWQRDQYQRIQKAMASAQVRTPQQAKKPSH